MQEQKITGYQKCPIWLRLKYRESVRFRCQNCHKHEELVGKLEPHRIKMGRDGGLYTLVPLNDVNNNIKMCCKRCHRIFTSAQNIASGISS